MGCLGHNPTSEVDKKININNTETSEIKIDSPKENEEKEIIIDESPFNKVEEIVSENEDINPYEKKETETKNPFDDFGSDLEEMNPFESFKIEPNLQKQFSKNFPGKTKIYSVTELSNERIAILDNDYNDLKIYSLKTCKLITKIVQDYVKNFIELKNKDIAACSSSKIYFYKLIKNKNYELYQQIDETQQGTNITKFIESFSPFEGEGGHWDENYYCLNSVYELLNGNLISCNSYGIKIYKRNINNEYELIHKERIETNEVKNVIEIKKNLLFIFCHDYSNPSTTFYCYTFAIYKFDIDKFELSEISSSIIKDVDDYRENLGYCNYLINNNFLFVRYGFILDVYDIEKNGKLIYNVEIHRKNKKIPFQEMMCNYDNNFIITRNCDMLFKIFKYENNSFKAVNYFPFTDKNIKGIVKLKNNNFILFSDNQIIILKNFD